MSKKDYYEKKHKQIILGRDVLLNRSKEYYINNRELIRERARNKYKSLTEDKKQKMKDYQKEYQKKYRDGKKEYQKKYREAKKLNKITVPA